MSSEVHPINPFAEVLAKQRYHQASLYKVAFTDARFSSGFGMYPPPATREPRTGSSLVWIMLKFAFVGGLGILLNQVLLFISFGFFHIYFLIGAILSSQVAVYVNFALNNFLVFRHRQTSGRLIKKALLFNAVSSSDLVVRIPLLWGLTSAFGLAYLYLANLASIFLTFGGRFLFSEKKIWARRSPQKNSTSH